MLSKLIIMTNLCESSNWSAHGLVGNPDEPHSHLWHIHRLVSRAILLMEVVVYFLCQVLKLSHGGFLVH